MRRRGLGRLLPRHPAQRRPRLHRAPTWAHVFLARPRRAAARLAPAELSRLRRRRDPCLDRPATGPCLHRRVGRVASVTTAAELRTRPVRRYRRLGRRRRCQRNRADLADRRWSCRFWNGPAWIGVGTVLFVILVHRVLAFVLVDLGGVLGLLLGCLPSAASSFCLLSSADASG